MSKYIIFSKLIQSFIFHSLYERNTLKLQRSLFICEAHEKLLQSREGQIGHKYLSELTKNMKFMAKITLGSYAISNFFQLFS